MSEQELKPDKKEEKKPNQDKQPKSYLIIFILIAVVFFGIDLIYYQIDQATWDKSRLQLERIFPQGFNKNKIPMHQVIGLDEKYQSELEKFLPDAWVSGKMSELEKLVSLEDLERLKHNTYSTAFANEVDIDAQKSNFYYDGIAAAYTFMPSYNWSTYQACEDAYCGEGARAWFYATEKLEQEFCLGSNCLAQRANTLLYNRGNLALPGALGSYSIKNITIYPLDTKWLVGIVYQDAEGEKGRAYSFDGSTWEDLDKDNQFPFVADTERNGYSIGFGGSDDNFLVIYGAYDIVAYQVVNGEKYDISKFLGLRISRGGFSPIAFSQKRGNETLWYVCSRDQGEPRLIKLWQNGSSNIQGSLSFSASLTRQFSGLESAWCKPGAEAGSIELIAQVQDRYFTRTLTDNGFVEQDEYALYSRNIFSGEGQVYMFRANNPIACTHSGCLPEDWGSDLSFMLSLDDYNYFEPELEEYEIVIKKNVTEIYWSFIAKGNSYGRDYSPWLKGVLGIDYAWLAPEEPVEEVSEDEAPLESED